MTEQEIREGAPEGGTHYRKRQLSKGYVFYKYELGKKLMFWCDDKWRYTENTITSDKIKPL